MKHDCDGDMYIGFECDKLKCSNNVSPRALALALALERKYHRDSYINKNNEN